MLEARGGRCEAQLAQRLSVMLLAMADARAVLVKLADRLQHMRSLTAMSAGAATAAAGEALDVFAPLANRLGVWSIKAELEDLAFQARALRLLQCWLHQYVSFILFLALVDVSALSVQCLIRWLLVSTTCAAVR